MRGILQHITAPGLGTAGGWGLKMGFGRVLLGGFLCDSQIQSQISQIWERDHRAVMDVELDKHPMFHLHVFIFPPLFLVR